MFIVCEGNEEYEYLECVKELKVWNEQYDISLVNAGGSGIWSRMIRLPEAVISESLLSCLRVMTVGGLRKLMNK